MHIWVLQGSKGALPKGCKGLEGSGLSDLIIAAIQLQLDPLTNLLAPDLEVSSFARTLMRL